MKKEKQLKATSLRTFLIISIFLLLTISVVGFYFTQNYLRELAVKNLPQDTNTTATNTTTSDTEAIQAEVAKYQDIGNKSSSFFASSQTHQNQITNDIKSYASVSGININNLSFDQSTSSNSDSRSTSSSGGLNSKNVIITIENPVQFTKLMKFIKGIESNLPKMQVSNISITPSSSSKEAVSVEPITIDYYVR